MSVSLQQENENLKWRLRQLETQMVTMQRPVSGLEAAEMEQCAAAFDASVAALGDSAPPPMPGETPLDYRRRLCAKLAKYCPEYENARFDSVDPALLTVVEPRLHAGAREAARNSAQPGKMIAVSERDSSGRLITKHYGDPLAWMGAFMLDGQCGRLNTDPNRR